MQKNSRYTRHLQHRHDYKIKRDNQGNRVIVTRDIEIYLKPSNRNNNVGISIEKKAEGRSYEEASTRAEDIKYSYEVDDKTLLLDGYAITEYANKYRDQEVKVILTLPDGVTIFADDNTSSYNNSWKYDDYITIDNKEEKYLQIINGELVCENCPDDENEWEYKESDDDSVNININTDDSDTKLKINEEGVRLKSEEVDIKIDENGIDIKTDN